MDLQKKIEDLEAELAVAKAELSIARNQLRDTRAANANEFEDITSKHVVRHMAVFGQIWFSIADAMDLVQNPLPGVKELEKSLNDLFFDCEKELDPLGLWDHFCGTDQIPWEIKNLREDRDLYKKQYLELKVKLLDLGK